MAEQMRPASKEVAPDPSDNYERAHPEHESGMGRLDNNTRATPTKSPDASPDAVKNSQDGSKQINAHNDLNPHKSPDLDKDDLKKEDESVGWEAPTDL
jgi:hypothetical protein